MKVYAFIDDQKTDFAIETLCKVTGVSRSAFYDWVARRDQGPSPAAQVEAVLVEQIRRIHRRSRSAYGAPRVVAQLAKQDVVVNHKRVERLMRVHQIQGRCGRRKIRTTVRDPLASPSPDLVDRHFEPDGLDVLWIGDVTYIPTGEGWLYLATVLDACSRRLLGWSLDDHMRAELCVDALDAAVGTRGGLRRLVTGVIFHSDHAPSTRRGSTVVVAAGSGSCNRWAPSATRTTTRRPRRSSRRSSGNSSITPTSRPRPRHASRSSSGSPGTTTSDSTRRCKCNHQSSTSNTSTQSYK